MAKECAICNKTGRMVGRRVKLRGKYNPTTKTRKQPNLQWVSVPIDAKREIFRAWRGKRVKACTKCLRTLRKVK